MDRADSLFREACTSQVDDLTLLSEIFLSVGDTGNAEKCLRRARQNLAVVFSTYAPNNSPEMRHKILLDDIGYRGR